LKFYFFLTILMIEIKNSETASNYYRSESRYLKLRTSCYVVTYHVKISFFFFFKFLLPSYWSKFSSLLAMTNLRRRTYGAYKVNSPLPTEYSTYTWVRNRTPDHILKRTKSLITWTNSLLLSFFNFYYDLSLYYDIIVYKISLYSLYNQIKFLT
jgi:hypothetical protein